MKGGGQVKTKSNMFKIITLIGDIILINLGFYLAFIFLFSFSPNQSNIDAYIAVMPFISITTVLIFENYGLYKILKKGILEIIYSIGLSIVFITIITVVIAFFIRSFAFPRSVILVSPFIQFILLSIWRYCVWKIRRRAHGIKRIAIIGSLEEIDEIARKIFKSSRGLYNPVLVPQGQDIKHIYCALDKADSVLIGPSLGEDEKSKVISFCIGTNIKAYIIPKLYDILISGSEVSQFDDIPTFKVTSLGLTVEQKLMKRVFDFCMALLGLIIASPIMLLVAIAIKFDSKGPIFYYQERVTANDKQFKLIKFRTMVIDAEKCFGPVLASKNDPRVTRVGRFIRSTRLDEIPQLINVLLGDMSFIGPRPERQFFIEQFKKEIPNYGYRHVVKAGITGFAQVHGKYTTGAADKLRYDLMYIRNYSFLLDIKIILQTIKIVFMKDSSEGMELDKSLISTIGNQNYDIFAKIGARNIKEA